jgi:hypothetical protein
MPKPTKPFLFLYSSRLFARLFFLRRTTMFHVVKTSIALAATGFLTAACSSGAGSMMSKPAVSTPAPVASAATPTTGYTTTPAYQAAPAGSYAQPVAYTTTQPTVVSSTPTVNYTPVQQPTLVQSAPTFPAIGTDSMRPASAATLPGTQSYQTMPLQTPSFGTPSLSNPAVLSAPALPNTPTLGAQSLVTPALTSQTGTAGTAMIKGGTTAASALGSGATLENAAIQGAGAAANYGANALINQ